MGHSVTKWIATDEEEFNDEKSMILHELSLLDRTEIDFFLTEIKQISGPRLTEYKKILNAWQRYIRESSNDTPPTKQVTTQERIENMSPEELAKAYEGIFNAQQKPEWIPEGGYLLDTSAKEEEEAINNSFKKATRI